MSELSFLFAFLAGFLSFASPCVLPLIPGFIAYLSGTTLAEAKTHRKDTFITSVFFVLGFSAVFALIGVLLNSALENVAFSVQEWLSRIGGLVIIFFGLFLMGFFKIGFLQKEYKIHLTKQFASKNLTAAIFGAAFAVGWSPCVGAVLGGILAFAATNPGSAFFLLLMYAVGFGVPFLLMGLFAAEAQKFVSRFAKVAKYLNIAFGVLLVWLGILVFTQTLNRFASFEFLNNLLK